MKEKKITTKDLKSLGFKNTDYIVSCCKEEKGLGIEWLGEFPMSAYQKISLLCIVCDRKSLQQFGRQCLTLYCDETNVRENHPYLYDFLVSPSLSLAEHIRESRIRIGRDLNPIRETIGSDFWVDSNSYVEDLPLLLWEMQHFCVRDPLLSSAIYSLLNALHE